MKKKFINIIFAVVLAVLAVVPEQGVEAFENNLPYFVDNANLVDNDDEIEQKLSDISIKQDCDVVIVTVDSLDGKTATEYADDYFDYNGYGKGSDNDGILFLISMEYHDWAISTTGFGIEAFTDAGQEYIIDEVKPYLSGEEYEAAFEEFADLCDKFISKAREGEAYDSSNLPKKRPSIIWIPVSLLIGFILAFVSTSAAKSKLKSVRRQMAASSYVVDGSLNIRVDRETFLYRKLNRRAKPKEKSGSSTHTSSSGTRHGGSSGKF